MKNDRPFPWAAVLYGGFVAGTIDIGAATLINWVNPVVILDVIASGLLGKAAFQGGVANALLGLALQWIMSLLIAAVYVGISRVVPALDRLWIFSGIVYGVVVFLVMNYVVVPLSAAPFGPHFTLKTFVANLLAMLVFGLIVAFFSQRFAARQRKLLVA